jgi:hypothetical protein
MRKLHYFFVGAMLVLGTTAQAEMPERPLPPAPADNSKAAPMDCDPATHTNDPDANVIRDCPTQSPPNRNDNSMQKEHKGKSRSQSRDYEQGGEMGRPGGQE